MITFPYILLFRACSYKNSRKTLCRNCKRIFFCSNPKQNKNRISKIKLPEEPQNCCMSGCANCVWISYAEELAKLLNDGGETARDKIIEHVKDPNLRAFLMLELNHLFKKK